MLREAIELLYFGYRSFTANADRILAQRGLGRVHHRLLYFVGRNPDASVNALLKVLGVTKQALNAPLRRMIDMKLISAQASAEDGRVKQLRLTAEGKRLEAALTGAQMRQLEAVFDTAGARAEQAWRSVMVRLAGDA